MKPASIQVPCSFGLGAAAQPSMTRSKSRSKRTVKRPCRRVRCRRREAWKPEGNSTARGSGENHISGGALNQGKIPLR
jgi:hypothetical protein